MTPTANRWTSPASYQRQSADGVIDLYPVQNDGREVHVEKAEADRMRRKAVAETILDVVDMGVEVVTQQPVGTLFVLVGGTILADIARNVRPRKRNK